MVSGLIRCHSRGSQSTACQERPRIYASLAAWQLGCCAIPVPQGMCSAEKALHVTSGSPPGSGAVVQNPERPEEGFGARRRSRLPRDVSWWFVLGTIWPLGTRSTVRGWSGRGGPAWALKPHESAPVCPSQPWTESMTRRGGVRTGGADLFPAASCQACQGLRLIDWTDPAGSDLRGALRARCGGWTMQRRRPLDKSIGRHPAGFLAGPWSRRTEQTAVRSRGCMWKVKKLSGLAAAALAAGVPN